MIVHQLQKWTQHVRDLTFAQLHVPLMAAFFQLRLDVVTL